ncbi:MAG: hypothetical protein RLZZ272_239 [Actinomycetota bacterium]
MQQSIQRFGGFLAGMIIPNLGAFIAWGLITALFIPTGWAPNETFVQLVGPMILQLLPLLIGFSGGRMVHGIRGGVVGAGATMGVIVGTSAPMFLGAMIMGPLAGYLVKKFDEATEDKVPPGFELLVNNFSAGIIIFGLSILGLIGVGPVVEAISNAAGSGVDVLAENRLLPLAALFIEPAKVLFLNNAINIGVLAPLGAEQALETGRSVLFMLETNPGPGLGLLTAYFVAGKGLAKATAPGAIIIHFLGGIHEIYFPFVLSHPIMIVAMWAGGLSANFWSVVTGAGLTATPSPGSIFAYLAVTPPGQFFNVIMHVAIGAIVSFVVGFFILKAVPARDMEGEDEGAAEGSSGASIPGLA